MTNPQSTVDPTMRALPLAPGGELELRLGANRLRVRAPHAHERPVPAQE